MKITCGDFVRYVEIGALVLSLAFMISFVGSLGIDPVWRLEAILEANPPRYVDYLLHMFLYLILPLVVGLVLIVIGYIKERVVSTVLLSRWPLAIAGGIFVVWGALLLQWACYSYHGVFLTIYAPLAVAGGLWLTTDVSLIYSPIRKIVSESKR